MTRTITHRPAFDDMVNGCAHKTKGDHGRGSVHEVWTLSRSDGFGIVWGIFTGWHLPETYEQGRDIHGDALRWASPAHMADAVEFHSPVPLSYPAWETDECKVTGARCWWDVSYLLGDDILEVLVREGTEATWTRLEEVLDSWVAELNEVKT